jgi:hypothetical protein
MTDSKVLGVMTAISGFQLHGSNSGAKDWSFVDAFELLGRVIPNK